MTWKCEICVKAPQCPAAREATNVGANINRCESFVSYDKPPKKPEKEFLEVYVT